MKFVVKSILLSLALVGSSQAQTETACPKGIPATQCGKCYVGEKISGADGALTTSVLSLQNNSSDDWMVTMGTVQMEVVPLTATVKVNPSKVDASFPDSLVFFKDDGGKDVALVFANTAVKALNIRYAGVSVDQAAASANPGNAILMTKITLPIRIWDFDKKKVTGSFSQLLCVFSPVQ